MSWPSKCPANRAGIWPSQAPKCQASGLKASVVRWWLLLLDFGAKKSSAGRATIFGELAFGEAACLTQLEWEIWCD